MSWLCRLTGHRWQYHGAPAGRRRCVTCSRKEWLTAEGWTDVRPTAA